MPLKPTKRGINMWQRSDAKCGYTYDFNIYAGKETTDCKSKWTLGERVLRKLVETTKSPTVNLWGAWIKQIKCLRITSPIVSPQSGGERSFTVSWWSRSQILGSSTKIIRGSKSPTSISSLQIAKTNGKASDNKFYSFWIPKIFLGAAYEKV